MLNLKGNKMNKQEAVNYCYENRDKFVHSFESIDEGVRQFECLVTILESGTITPDEISDYGMEF